MANLLADPNNWKSYSESTGSFTGPPSEYWDASTNSYYFYASMWSMSVVEMVLSSAPNSGDTVEGTFNPLTLNISSEIPSLTFYDANYNVIGSVTGAVDDMVPFSFPAVAGMKIATAKSGDHLYVGESRVYVPEEPIPMISYNCECDDDYPRVTLAEMRKRLMRRLGFAVQANNPPPGMADLLDDFVRNAQEMLFRRYNAFRRERFYTWDMQAGVRFYDLDANADVCTKKLDPHMVSWVGVSEGDDNWRPLVCGIDPTVYTSNISGIPDHYEIRQCIEVWPPPADNAWKLRIKGQFGLMPLEIDSDETTVEPEAIFLLALANAKAHYGQPDGGNYASQLTAYIRDLVRGSHHTARYLPGRNDVRNAVRPVPVGGWPEDP